MLKWVWVGATLLAANLTMTAPAEAQDAPPALMASQCLSCHAAAEGNIMPTLAGMDAGAIETALHAYKDGTLEATIMDRIAAGYTDAQIAEIAREIASWTH